MVARLDGGKVSSLNDSWETVTKTEMMLGIKVHPSKPCLAETPPSK